MTDITGNIGNETPEGGNNSDAGKQGENWEARFKGLSKKFTEVSGNVERLTTQNEELHRSINQILEQFGPPENGGDDGAEENPIDALVERINGITAELEEQKLAAAQAKLDAARVKLFSEFDLKGMDKYVRVVDDLDEQRAILEEFSEELGTRIGEEVRKKSAPPKTSKPTPKTPGKTEDISALRSIMNEALASGDEAAIEVAQANYYAAVDKTLPDKWFA